MSKNPPDLPGIPGALTKAANNFRKATQIFPPPGVGVGVGLGLGCGFGWPLRQAYGPPRALCGPSIGVGVGFGYGQGFGRRFGLDDRPQPLRNWLRQLESLLDSTASRLLAPFRRQNRPPVETSLTNVNVHASQPLPRGLTPVRA